MKGGEWSGDFAPSQRRILNRHPGASQPLTKNRPADDSRATRICEKNSESRQLGLGLRLGLTESGLHLLLSLVSLQHLLLDGGAAALSIPEHKR